MNKEEYEQIRPQLEAQQLDQNMKGENARFFNEEDEDNDFSKLAMELDRMIDAFCYTLAGKRKDGNEWVDSEHKQRLANDHMIDVIRTTLQAHLNPNNFLTNFDDDKINEEIWITGRALARQIAKNWTKFECETYDPRHPFALTMNMVEAALYRAKNQGERNFWRPQSKRIEHILGGMRDRNENSKSFFS